MSQQLLLITPPFTQLNTPYPATAYLKGFLNTKGIPSTQCDLGIEVILDLFSSEGLRRLFNEIQDRQPDLSDNSRRIMALRKDYLKTIDQVIDFLQDNNPTLGHIICEGNYLPEASRFSQLDDLEWAFGTMGTRDKARHLATLYLEDLSDLVIEAIDPHFGFSRYAERLGRSANSFDALHAELQKPDSFIDTITLRLLREKIAKTQPTLVALSVPFPGNLYSALKCGQWLKQHHPEMKVVMGGGFANTELRSLTDVRVLEYFDFICLDDGEAPIYHLIEHLDGRRSLEMLKRTFALANGEVTYFNGSIEKDYPQRETGTPDYSDFLLDKYLSVIEIANPMHRLWSDGRWNKLTLAHGCYWGKCTFCDISLDYIQRYEPLTARLLCDRMEEIIQQTGQNGFHFVDEAAPPALMRELALEIIRRELTVVWWTNIRFEKSFTLDLCRLLKESGCIAISGGLEVASDRLLGLIKKGVTIAQVAKVADNLTQSGIMVHAYLMYGFPTQTAQETVDSLEVVRQLFEQGVVQSGFWHQFAMTAHSPVGLSPALFGAEKLSEEVGSFANNDIYHRDPGGADHEAFSEGLRKSLFNYMHGLCFEFPLQEWFDFKIPQTTIPPNLIHRILTADEPAVPKPNAKLVWLGNSPMVSYFSKKKKGRNVAMAEIVFANKKDQLVLQLKGEWGQWLEEMLPLLMPGRGGVFTYSQLQEHFNARYPGQWEQLWNSRQWQELRENGLLVL
ncbi:B12-binding domain-containing radical SAM protein [Nafulsella turpanensis]|uniref:B12-binding domain-containing radical SAM protein n=1 Tax=Nafulsella turpanensis TaxID=1265690 RepID=UPI0003459C8D|nr:radical SAM protein [Nafulsella turpanensis]